jgi:hypothetical protein
MESRKVWCLPHQETEVNLNQTVVYSENPLTKVNLNNSFELGQLGSMDFLSSDNLNSMVDIDHYKGKLCIVFLFFLQIHVYKLLI